MVAGKANYLARLWELRHFWYLLVRFDLRNRYKGSYLGIGWSLAKPFGMTAVLCLVFGKLFQKSYIEFAPFLLVGMTVWQFITESVMNGCHSFSASKSFLFQRRIPLAALPLRTVLACTFHSVMALTLAVVITLLARSIAPVPSEPSSIAAGHPAPALLTEAPTQAAQPATVKPAPQLWPLIFLLPAFVLLFLFGWFLATIMSMATAHFPDARHLAEIGLQVLFYLTPIMYPPSLLEGRGRLTWFIELNPLTYLLNLFRVPILDGIPPTANDFLITMGLVAGLGFIVSVGLRRLERTMIFWI